jgi:hypothetical protein
MDNCGIAYQSFLAGRGTDCAHGVVEAFSERAKCGNNGNNGSNGDTVHGHFVGLHQVNAHTIEHLDSGNKKAPSGGPEGALVLAALAGAQTLGTTLRSRLG